MGVDIGEDQLTALVRLAEGIGGVHLEEGEVALVVLIGVLTGLGVDSHGERHHD